MSKSIFISILLSIVLCSCANKDNEPVDFSVLPVLEITSIVKTNDNNFDISLTDNKSGKYVALIDNNTVSDMNLKKGDKIKISGDYAESYPVQILRVTKVKKVEN
jgi:hypothetical protein